MGWAGRVRCDRMDGRQTRRKVLLGPPQWTGQREGGRGVCAVILMNGEVNLATNIAFCADYHM